MLLKHCLDNRTARQMIDATLDKALEKQWHIAVAICDFHGALLAFGRDDNAIPEVTDFAIDKAYSAARMGCSTASLFERAQKKPQLMAGLQNRHRLLLFPGGLPIIKDKEIIAAIGISGAQDHEDVALAEQIITKFGFGYD